MISKLYSVSFTASLTIWGRTLPELLFHEDKFRAQNNAICDCNRYATFVVHWLSAYVVTCRGLPHTVLVLPKRYQLHFALNVG